MTRFVIAPPPPHLSQASSCTVQLLDTATRDILSRSAGRPGRGFSAPAASLSQPSSSKAESLWRNSSIRFSFPLGSISLGLLQAVAGVTERIWGGLRRLRPDRRGRPRKHLKGLLPFVKLHQGIAGDHPTDHSSSHDTHPAIPFFLPGCRPLALREREEEDPRNSASYARG